MPDLPPERLQQKARGWQAESPSATEPDELRAQLQGFWRLLFTSSPARSRDGVTGYGALHSACTSWMTRVHYTATSGLAPNPEREPALCPVSLQVPRQPQRYQVRSHRRGVCSPSSSATRSKWRVATRSHFRRSRSWATPGRGARSWRWARATSASRRRRARASSACSRRAPHLRRLGTPAFAPRLSPPHAPPRLISSYCAPLPQPLLHSFRTLPSVPCHPFAGLPQG